MNAEICDGCISGGMIDSVLSNLIVALQNDKRISWIFNDITQKMSVNEFVHLIYKLTLRDESLWFNIKPYFVGSENIIRLVSKHTGYSVKHSILPIHFISSTKPFTPKNDVPAEFVISGLKGELEGLKLLNERLKGKFKGFESGKIPWDNLPCVAVTPDLILGRRKTCEKITHIDLANPDILGVAEIKTALLSQSKRESFVDDDTAGSWMKKTRSVGQQLEFCPKGKREDIFKTCPDYMSSYDFTILKKKFLKAKWKAVYGQNYKDIAGDDVVIKPLTGKVSRQLFSEMLSIAPHVHASSVFGLLMFVNLNADDQSFESCFFARVKVPKDVLMRIRVGIVEKFYHLYVMSEDKIKK